MFATSDTVYIVNWQKIEGASVFISFYSTHSVLVLFASHQKQHQRQLPGYLLYTAVARTKHGKEEKRSAPYTWANSDDKAEIFSFGVFPPDEKTSGYFQKPPSELWSSKKIKVLLFNDPPTNSFSLIFQKTCLIIQYSVCNSG